MLNDLILFEGQSALAIAALILIYGFAFAIRGMIGFGSVTPAVLLSAFLVSPHKAVLLALITSTYAQAQLMPQGFKDGDWRIVRPLLGGCILSIIVGTWIFANLSSSWLAIVMAVFLAFAILADQLNLTGLVSAYLTRHPIAVPFGLSTVAGLLSTIAGGGMMYFLSVYTKWAAPDPGRFRGTNILISAFSNFWRVTVFAVAGLIDTTLLVEGLILLPSTLAGGWVGAVLARRITPDRFFAIVRVLLLIAAALLAWKGISQIVR